MNNFDESDVPSTEISHFQPASPTKIPLKQMIDEEIFLAPNLSTTKPIYVDDEFAKPLDLSVLNGEESGRMNDYDRKIEEEEEVIFKSPKRTINQNSVVSLNANSNNSAKEENYFQSLKRQESVTLTRHEYEKLLLGVISTKNDISVHSATGESSALESLAISPTPQYLTGQHRKSDEDLVGNTAKRERTVPEVGDVKEERAVPEAKDVTEEGTASEETEDENNLSSHGSSNCDVEVMRSSESGSHESIEIPSTPQKSLATKSVSSFSSEFEQKLASIQVTPKREILKESEKTEYEDEKTASLIKSQLGYRVSASPVNDRSGYREATLRGSTPPPPAYREISPIRPTPALSPVKRVEAQIVNHDAEEKFSRQVDFLQYENSSLQEKYEKSLQSNAEMRSMITEYERTLAQFIDSRRARPDQHYSVDQLLQEKKNLELEIQTLQISFQNLHQRYEDIKGLHEQSRISEATLKQTVQVLQLELANSVRNLDSARKIYEERLEKANLEIVSLKASLENELSVTKARLLKGELKINSLESAVEAKTRENTELMTICDELIRKMDRKS